MVDILDNIPKKPSDKIIDACNKKGVNITETKTIQVYKSEKKLKKQCDITKKHRRLRRRSKSFKKSKPRNKVKLLKQHSKKKIFKSKIKEDVKDYIDSIKKKDIVEPRKRVKSSGSKKRDDIKDYIDRVKSWKEPPRKRVKSSSSKKRDDIKEYIDRVKSWKEPPRKKTKSTRKRNDKIKSYKEPSKKRDDDNIEDYINRVKSWKEPLKNITKKDIQELKIKPSEEIVNNIEIACQRPNIPLRLTNMFFILLISPPHKKETIKPYLFKEVDNHLGETLLPSQYQKKVEEIVPVDTSVRNILTKKRMDDDNRKVYMSELDKLTKRVNAWEEPEKIEEVVKDFENTMNKPLFDNADKKQLEDAISIEENNLRELQSNKPNEKNKINEQVDRLKMLTELSNKLAHEKRSELDNEIKLEREKLNKLNMWKDKELKQEMKKFREQLKLQHDMDKRQTSLERDRISNEDRDKKRKYDMEMQKAQQDMKKWKREQELKLKQEQERIKADERSLKRLNDLDIRKQQTERHLRELEIRKETRKLRSDEKMQLQNLLSQERLINKQIQETKNQLEKDRKAKMQIEKRKEDAEFRRLREQLMQRYQEQKNREKLEKELIEGQKQLFTRSLADRERQRILEAQQGERDRFAKLTAKQLETEAAKNIAKQDRKIQEKTLKQQRQLQRQQLLQQRSLAKKGMKEDIKQRLRQNRMIKKIGQEQMLARRESLREQRAKNLELQRKVNEYQRKALEEQEKNRQILDEIRRENLEAHREEEDLKAARWEEFKDMMKKYSRRRPEGRAPLPIFPPPPGEQPRIGLDQFPELRERIESLSAVDSGLDIDDISSDGISIDWNKAKKINLPDQIKNKLLEDERDHKGIKRRRTEDISPIGGGYTRPRSIPGSTGIPFKGFHPVNNADLMKNIREAKRRNMDNYNMEESEPSYISASNMEDKRKWNEFRDRVENYLNESLSQASKQQSYQPPPPPQQQPPPPPYSEYSSSYSEDDTDSWPSISRSEAEPISDDQIRNLVREFVNTEIQSRASSGESVPDTSSELNKEKEEWSDFKDTVTKFMNEEQIREEQLLNKYRKSQSDEAKWDTLENNLNKYMTKHGVNPEELKKFLNYINKTQKQTEVKWDNLSKKFRNFIKQQGLQKKQTEDEIQKILQAIESDNNIRSRSDEEKWNLLQKQFSKYTEEQGVTKNNIKKFLEQLNRSQQSSDTKWDNLSKKFNDFTQQQGLEKEATEKKLQEFIQNIEERSRQEKIETQKQLQQFIQTQADRFKDFIEREQAIKGYQDTKINDLTRKFENFMNQSQNTRPPVKYPVPPPIIFTPPVSPQQQQLPISKPSPPLIYAPQQTITTTPSPMPQQPMVIRDTSRGGDFDRSIRDYMMMDQQSRHAEGQMIQRSHQELQNAMRQAAMVVDRQNQLLAQQGKSINDLERWIRDLDANNKKRDEVIDKLVRELIGMQQVTNAAEIQRMNALNATMARAPVQPLQYFQQPMPSQMPMPNPYMGNVYSQLLASQIKSNAEKELNAKLVAMEKEMEELRQQNKSIMQKKQTATADEIRKQIVETTGRALRSDDKKRELENRLSQYRDAYVKGLKGYYEDSGMSQDEADRKAREEGEKIESMTRRTVEESTPSNLESLLKKTLEAIAGKKYVDDQEQEDKDLRSVVNELAKTVQELTQQLSQKQNIGSYQIPMGTTGSKPASGLSTTRNVYQDSETQKRLRERTERLRKQAQEGTMNILDEGKELGDLVNDLKNKADVAEKEASKGLDDANQLMKDLKKLPETNPLKVAYITLAQELAAKRIEVNTLYQKINKELREEFIKVETDVSDRLRIAIERYRDMPYVREFTRNYISLMGEDSKQLYQTLVFTLNQERIRIYNELDTIERKIDISNLPIDTVQQSSELSKIVGEQSKLDTTFRKYLLKVADISDRLNDFKSTVTTRQDILSELQKTITELQKMGSNNNPNHTPEQINDIIKQSFSFKDIESAKSDVKRLFNTIRNFLNEASKFVTTNSGNPFGKHRKRRNSKRKSQRKRSYSKKLRRKRSIRVKKIIKGRRFGDIKSIQETEDDLKDRLIQEVIDNPNMENETIKTIARILLKKLNFIRGIIDKKVLNVATQLKTEASSGKTNVKPISEEAQNLDDNAKQKVTEEYKEAEVLYHFVDDGTNIIKGDKSGINNEAKAIKEANIFAITEMVKPTDEPTYRKFLSEQDDSLLSKAAQNRSKTDRTKFDEAVQAFEAPTVEDKRFIQETLKAEDPTYKKLLAKCKTVENEVNDTINSVEIKLSDSKYDSISTYIDSKIQDIKSIQNDLKNIDCLNDDNLEKKYIKSSDISRMIRELENDIDEILRKVDECRKFNNDIIPAVTNILNEYPNDPKVKEFITKNLNPRNCTPDKIDEIIIPQDIQQNATNIVKGITKQLIEECNRGKIAIDTEMNGYIKDLESYIQSVSIPPGTDPAIESQVKEKLKEIESIKESIISTRNSLQTYDCETRFKEGHTLDDLSELATKQLGNYDDKYTALVKDINTALGAAEEIMAINKKIRDIKGDMDSEIQQVESIIQEISSNLSSGTIKQDQVDKFLVPTLRIKIQEIFPKSLESLKGIPVVDQYFKKHGNIYSGTIGWALISKLKFSNIKTDFIQATKALNIICKELNKSSDVNIDKIEEKFKAVIELATSGNKTVDTKSGTINLPDGIYNKVMNNYNNIYTEADNTTLINIKQLSEEYNTEKDICGDDDDDDDTVITDYTAYASQILKSKNTRMIINQINDDYENITGIGKVIVKFRPQTKTKGNSLDTVNILKPIDDVKTTKDQGVTCVEFIDKFPDSNGPMCSQIQGKKFGDFTAVFYPNTSSSPNLPAYEEDPGTGSIESTVDLMDSIGFNMAMLSYGLSGSGKTFTLIGNEWEPNGTVRGIIQMIIETLEKKSVQGPMEIKLKALQLYEGNIYNAYSSDPMIYKYTFDKDEQGKVGVEYKNIIDKTTNPHVYGLYEKLFKHVKNVSKLDSVKLQTNLRNLLDINILKPFHSEISEKIMGQKFKNVQELVTDMAKDEVKLGQLIDNILLFGIANKSYDIDKLLIARNTDIDINKNYFDDGYDLTLKDNYIDQFNDYLANISSHRPARSTLKNPDSSRSHLFVRVNFTINGKTFDIYISDLGGVENAASYFGKASIEGFYIVSTLKMIEVMISNYNKYLPTKFDDLIDDSKVKESFNTEIVNPIYGSQGPKIIKWFEIAQQKSAGEPNGPYGNFHRNNFNGSDDAKMKGLGKGIYSIMKSMLKWDELQDPKAKFTKLISFINLRSTLFPGIDNIEKVENNNLCEATESSLVYGMKLYNTTGCSFGKRITRIRSFAKIRKHKSRRRKERSKRTHRRKSKKHIHTDKPRRSRERSGKRKERRRSINKEKKTRTRRTKDRSVNKKDLQLASLVVASQIPPSYSPGINGPIGAKSTITLDEVRNVIRHRSNNMGKRKKSIGKARRKLRKSKPRRPIKLRSNKLLNSRNSRRKKGRSVRK